MIDSPVFFCGIGGSGMLPLASIVRASGRQGRGLRPLARRRAHAAQVRLSALARHPAVPAGRVGPSGRHDPGHLGRGRGDRARRRPRAKSSGLTHLTRPQFLAELLNAAQRSVAVGGTSGKSTVTGMIGWILHACHRQPTVMNGAVMKNFVTPSAPFASALVGDPELFVSEVDESDGSIALYRPEIAVLTNISLDHKEMDELRQLFAGFLLSRAQGGAQPRRSRNPRARRRRSRRTRSSATASTAPGADFMGKDLQLLERRRDLRARGRRRAL